MVVAGQVKLALLNKSILEGKTSFGRQIGALPGHLLDPSTVKMHRKNLALLTFSLFVMEKLWTQYFLNHGCPDLWFRNLRQDVRLSLPPPLLFCRDQVEHSASFTLFFFLIKNVLYDGNFKHDN